MVRFSKTKVKMLSTYSHPDNKEIYLVHETYNVEDPEFSDFYHKWINNHLDIIPKNVCELVVNNKKKKI